MSTVKYHCPFCYTGDEKKGFDKDPEHIYCNECFERSEKAPNPYGWRLGNRGYIVNCPVCKKCPKRGGYGSMASCSSDYTYSYECCGLDTGECSYSWFSRVKWNQIALEKWGEDKSYGFYRI